MTSSQFVVRLNELDAPTNDIMESARRHREMYDLVIKFTDEEFTAGNFSACDVVFSLLNPSLLSASAITALLRATLCCSSLLPAREAFISDPIIVRKVCDYRGPENGYDVLRAMSSKPRLNVEFVLEEGARLPEYGSGLASGMDIFALQDIEIAPFGVTLVKTGVSLAYLDPRYELQVRPRSGNAVNKNISVVLGTVDADYRGPIGVMLQYWLTMSQLNHYIASLTGSLGIEVAERYSQPYKVKAGDKIAQLVCSPVERPRPVVVQAVSSTTRRGDDGFGSTDKKETELVQTLPPKQALAGEAALGS